MSKEARTFNQLQKEKTLGEFNDFAKKITELYANTEYNYSQKNAAMDNKITIKCLRQLMDYSIITNLVSLEIANMIYEKAIKTQQKKVTQAGGNSYNHHKEIIKERGKFIASGYSKTQIREIATDIAQNHFKTISYFSRKYGIESDYITKLLLQKSITENIISNEITEKLIERVFKQDQRESTKKYFDNLLKIRNEKNVKIGQAKNE